jgi:hypothetical protein
MARYDSPDKLAADLLKAATGVPVMARTVVKRGAQNIKDEARESVLRTAPVHNAGAHNAITYDEPAVVGARVESEIGYDRSIRGAALGNLLEFGGGGDHSPPHRDLGRATDAEEARFESALSTMAGKLL